MGCPVAGSSVGLLHLMEVPRYLRKRAHNELSAMEELMQQHVQVAEYMAKSMVCPPLHAFSAELVATFTSCLIGTCDVSYNAASLCSW